MSLENYLKESYLSDQQDVTEVEKALNAAVNVFQHGARFDKKAAWPYAIPASSTDTWLLSQNTTGMIVNTLLRYRGHFNTVDAEASAEFKRNIFPIAGALKACPPKRVFEAFDALFDSAMAGGAFQTKSKTYGPNDVFTLAWLAELCQANVGFASSTGAESDARITKIAVMKSALQPLVAQKATGWIEGNKRALFSPDGAVPEDHSFPVLRLVQAARRTSAIVDYVPFYNYFESRLHQQLSFSSIPDSRFDPAELTFCLEGMLLCQLSGVDRTIFDRVLEVLTIAQSNSAFWRPVKPFMATAQGMVLFPVSVEIANSLMRSCVIADAGKLHETYGSKSIKLLRRYWQWLRARAVASSNDSTVPHLGWHSEHVNQTAIIHLWETSQVMDFLMSYRNMLQHHIARTTLVLSRVKEESVQSESWGALEKMYEPVSSLGEGLSVYKNIGRDFVSGRGSDADDNYSMLLYGPPGTGKTTVAKSLAGALGYRMITITVSDFLASGGAQVESRAKDIFTMLMAQPPCVVLFDEIDHFLLDRDSTRYADQDTVFQFMTPGMLTKLADFRQLERVLFIVATNYEDRIDPAIKRTGRIDRKYLVLPPDGAKRLAIVAELLSKYKIASPEEVIVMDVETKQALSDSSLFLGYSDIKAVVQIFGKSGSRDLTKLAAAFEDRARTISLEGYQGRFAPTKSGVPALRETPMAEFLCLMALRAELRNAPPVAGKKAIAYAAEVIKTSTGLQAGTPEAISRCDAIGLDPDTHDEISGLFMHSE